MTAPMTYGRSRPYVVHTEAPERVTSTWEESLALSPLTSKVEVHTLTRMDQGCTSPSIRTLATHAEVKALVEEWGVPIHRIDNWSRLPLLQRIDALATWMLFIDQAVQSRLYQMESDVMGPTALRRIYSREVVMDDEQVEWVFHFLSHVRSMGMALSPSVHHGNREQFQSLQARHDVDTQVQAAKDRRTNLRLHRRSS